MASSIVAGVTLLVVTEGSYWQVKAWMLARNGALTVLVVVVAELFVGPLGVTFVGAGVAVDAVVDEVVAVGGAVAGALVAVEEVGAVVVFGGGVAGGVVAGGGLGGGAVGGGIVGFVVDGVFVERFAGELVVDGAAVGGVVGVFVVEAVSADLHVGPRVMGAVRGVERHAGHCAGLGVALEVA